MTAALDGTPETWLNAAREVLSVEMEGIGAVRDGLNVGFVQSLETLAGCTGRVVLTGVGKSGLIARKIAATFSSTGTAAFFLHPVEGAHGDLGMVRRDDVVLALSNSGETEELLALLPSLRGLGCRIISMTGASDSSLARQSDIVLCCRVPKEACALGLAPTASTTAALALGDALAVCLIRWKGVDACAFQRTHPGGALGRRLCLEVRQVMRRGDLPVAGEDTDFLEGLSVLDKGGLGVVVVVDGAGRVSGVVTDGDVRRLLLRGQAQGGRSMADVMTRRPHCVLPAHQVGEVLDIMEKRAITTLPVVDSEGRLEGVAHLHDLLGKGSVRFGAVAG